MRYVGGIADPGLNHHHPDGSAENVEQVAEERRCQAFALEKICDQQTDRCRRRVEGHTTHRQGLGQLTSGRDIPATGAMASKQLVFVYYENYLRQFIGLVLRRFRKVVGAGHSIAGRR